MAAQLGLTRASIWRIVRELSSFGVEIQAVRGRGYRLPIALEWLSSEEIISAMPHRYRSEIQHLHVLCSTDSTNSWLLRQAHTEGVSVCFAEHQSAARGRRGRSWLSPLGGNLAFSMRFRFEPGMTQLGGLSLIMALAMLRALRDQGVEGLMVKWPNDLVWQGRKLAGILLEIAGEPTGPCSVVAGIGLNFSIPDNLAASLDQPLVDLATITPGLGRNQLAACLLGHLLDALNLFKTEGLSAFKDEWRLFDWLDGQPLSLLQGEQSIQGRGCGIAADGSLCIEVDGVHQYHSFGEVSVRRQEPYRA